MAIHCPPTTTSGSDIDIPLPHLSSVDVVLDTPPDPLDMFPRVAATAELSQPSFKWPSASSAPAPTGLFRPQLGKQRPAVVAALLAAARARTLVDIGCDVRFS